MNIFIHIHRLNIRKKTFLAMRAVKYWDGKLQEVVESATLEVVKSKLDKHLGKTGRSLLGAES